MPQISQKHTQQFRSIEEESLFSYIGEGLHIAIVSLDDGDQIFGKIKEVPDVDHSSSRNLFYIQ